MPAIPGLPSSKTVSKTANAAFNSLRENLKEIAKEIKTEKSQDQSDRPYKFKQLEREEIKLLATVLCHQPPPTVAYDSSWARQYRAQTKLQMENLPESLREHPNMVMHYLNKKLEPHQREAVRELCPLHMRLNKPVVRSTLYTYKTEIDINIPALVTVLAESGFLDQDTIDIFDKLRDVSAMWIDYRLFKKTYGVTPKARWAYQEDRCAGCVLARLGSDKDVLFALKVGLGIRQGARPGRSKRVQYIGFLLDQFDGSEKDRKMADNLAATLYSLLEMLTETSSADPLSPLNMRVTLDDALPEDVVQPLRQAGPETQTAAETYTQPEESAPPERYSQPVSPFSRHSGKSSLNLSRHSVSPLGTPVSPMQSKSEIERRLASDRASPFASRTGLPLKAHTTGKVALQSPPSPSVYDDPSSSSKARGRETLRVLSQVIDQYAQTRYMPTLGDADMDGFIDEDGSRRPPVPAIAGNAQDLAAEYRTGIKSTPFSKEQKQALQASIGRDVKMPHALQVDDIEEAWRLNPYLSIVPPMSGPSTKQTHGSEGDKKYRQSRFKEVGLDRTDSRREQSRGSSRKAEGVSRSGSKRDKGMEKAHDGESRSTGRQTQFSDFYKKR